MTTACPDCKSPIIGRRWLSAETTFVEVYQCLAVWYWGAGSRHAIRCTAYKAKPAEVTPPHAPRQRSGCATQGDEMTPPMTSSNPW